MWKIQVFFFFSLGFFLTIVIGTISHEMGHILVAESLGYTTCLHFSSMTYMPFRGHEHFHDFYITVGGVVSTCFVGTLGVVYIQKSEKHKLQFWIAVFCALFWSRPVVNLVFKWTSCVFKNCDGVYYGGDELLLSQYLGLPNGFFSILFAAIGFTVLLYVFFKQIPSSYQFVFACSGIVGGGLSYFLWFYVLGPVLLP